MYCVIRLSLLLSLLFHLLDWAADYRSHPRFMPYELIEEVKKEELRAFCLDLLRSMRIKGSVPSRTRASLQQSPSEQETNGGNHKKFSLQFFDKFLDFLTMPTMDVDFYLKVLFPVLTNYLQKYAGYFMPSSDMQASSTTASKEEKMRILRSDSLFECSV